MRNWFIQFHSDYHEVLDIEGPSLEDSFKSEELDLEDYGYRYDENFPGWIYYTGLYWMWETQKPTTEEIQQHLDKNQDGLSTWGYVKNVE
jgi:hypothetical protein